MFGLNRRWLYLGLISTFITCFLSVGCSNAISFTQRLEEIGLDVDTFSNKKSISRYEMTRLLNAANCEDCIQAPDWMKQTYTKSFWNDFRGIDGKDFDDIDYLGAFWNKRSYYYCVAYVGDNGYMAGYPKTSTKCQGNFCGQDSITVSEAYQTLLNIIQDQIREKYEVNWSNVKSWMNGLSKVKRSIILNQTNIDAIKNADSKSNFAQTNDEFQAWLKYCMYNLGACNFQTFGKIGQAYWPISELNILYKEGIISWEDAMKVAESNDSLNGEDALRIFGLVFDNYSSCSFNVDYDCDEVSNGLDNCPYVYNQNQYDLDGDGIGNVCDNDIDGDGKKNSVGIVDDNDNIVLSLWNDNLDQTPVGDGNLGFSFFINVSSITTGFPTTVTFEPLTNGDIDSIEWDFGDGNTKIVKNGNKINHTFKTSGTFIVKATAKSKRGGKVFAMTKIFISDAEASNYVLNISPSFIFKNGLVEFTLTPLYSGNLDKIVWDVNDGSKKTQSVGEKYKFSVSDDGLYVVNARGYKNGELKAVSMLTLNKNGSPSFSTMTITPKYLWEDTSVITNLVGVLRKDIDRISIDWGDETTNSSNLSQKHTYNEGGLKTIQQKVFLKDGSVLYAVATVYIQNPNMLKSYALNVVGDKLVYDQNEKLALGLSMYPKTSVVSLFTSYQAGKKNYVLNPNLNSIILDFAYITAGDKALTNSVEVNNCVSLLNQGNVHVNSVDLCQLALRTNTLSKYKCDKDKDGIPDICDDDIDGDGKKNLVGIILQENKDCSVNASNVNPEIFRKEFGVCSLDNCPFDLNKDQGDLNNNGVGDTCETSMLKLLDSIGVINGGDGISTIIKDQDQDGFSDDEDICPTIPGNSIDGCPTNNVQNCWVYSSCGNGVKDEGENCLNCPQDVGECCGNGILEAWESCRSCPQDAGECGLCGNGKIEAGENCINCPEDVGECTAYCGNGEIEEAEDCRNCPQDVGECTAICGDGEIQPSEDCNNCSKDVKKCREETCGDGNLDVDAGEECDHGDKNGKDRECTKMCTKYDSNRPKCGNDEIDEGEDCNTCRVDLGEKCVKGGDKEKPETCGNGKIDEGESCDPNDDSKINWGEYGCSNSCQSLYSDAVLCNPDYDGQPILGTLLNSPNLCLKGILRNFSFNKLNLSWSWFCIDGENSVKCSAKMSSCGDGSISRGKICDICSKDLKDICIGDGNVKIDCQCDECPDFLKDRCLGTGTDSNDSDCKCNECPRVLGKRCMDDGIHPYIIDCKCDKCPRKVECMNDGIDPNNPNCKCGECVGYFRDGCIGFGEIDLCGNGREDKGENCVTCPRDVEGCDNCGNGVVDEGETYENCPDDFGGGVWSSDCNICPCEYVDFSTDLVKGDIIRAKLWDKPNSVFYKYSNSVAVENYLDVN